MKQPHCPQRIIVHRETQEQQESLPDALHPLLRRVYLNRNLTQETDLDTALDQLLPPTGLAGIEAAAELLHRALEDDARILVIGDFDADGATSCALALRALRSMGASRVGYRVPNRFEYGYGLTPGIVSEVLEDAPDLLITVDNGISSVDGVALAKAAGLRVLITDHHLPGAQLPEADVIVNPNQSDDNFGSKHLAGVGVIFYLMVQLRSRLRELGWFERRGLAPPNLARLLDLVALGTVADLVPLDRNNRILVAQGLARIRSGNCCQGIAALVGISGRETERVVASDLGYAVGPRLNAAGRLDDMSTGIECLLTDDRERAGSLAAQLDSLNRERRVIEDEMKQQALRHLEALPDTEVISVGLSLFDESWHQGVIGILAARIREVYHRPVIAFAPADREYLKGSARSVPGLHIRDVLDAVAAGYPGLLEKFGGHAMAAGLTLRRADLERFSEAFDREVRRRLDAESLRGVILTDGIPAADDYSLQVAELLRNSGPWGQGFPEPLFDDRFQVIGQRILGEKHIKLMLQPLGSQARIDAIAFNQAQNWQGAVSDCVRAAFRLDVNSFRGTTSLQLIIEHMEDMEDL